MFSDVVVVVVVVVVVDCLDESDLHDGDVEKACI